MIRYFNPGHEAAVWSDSPYYQPPASVLKMQEDLAFLPFWYADPGDFICVPELLPVLYTQLEDRRNVYSLAYSNVNDEIELLKDQKIDFWGLSRQGLHFFENFSKKYNLALRLPEWEPEYRNLSSRELAAECLSAMAEKIPEIPAEIIPSFFSNLPDIEQFNRLSPDKLLAKSPYSSSGRGLLWLEQPDLSRSSRQIIQGVLNRQKTISLEKALEKFLDFSMHFSSDGFLGFSIFYTNAKGAYEKTWLASQEKIKSKLTEHINPDLLEEVKEFLSEFIQEKIRPYYKGNVGIDMMIYRSRRDFYFHPCVEINLRKSMGYLSLRLHQNFLHQDSEAYFSVAYNSDAKAIPPVFLDNGKLKQGIFDLCPVDTATKYRAILNVKM
jgi:hypothetical protein